jgi:hypothetical protein
MLKLKQLSILLRIAGNIISFILLTEASKNALRGMKVLGG